MTLLIACLLIHMGGLSGGWYVLAVWIWFLRHLPALMKVFPDAGPDS